MTDPAQANKGNNLLLIPIIGALVTVILILIVVLSLGGNSSFGITESSSAKQELEQRVERSFTQGFSVPESQVTVSLGDEEPLEQYKSLRAKSVLVIVQLNGEESKSLLSSLTGLQKEWLSTGGDVVKLGASFDVPLLGKTGVGANQVVSAQEGKLVLTPDAFYLSGLKASLQDILKIPVLGDWIKDFSTAQTYCVADRAPAGFTLQNAKLSGEKITFTFQAKEQSLAVEDLQSFGTCES